MTPTAVLLLVGVAGVVGALIALTFTVVRTRRASARIGAVPQGLVIRAIALGAVFVLSVAAIVAAVLLQ